MNETEVELKKREQNFSFFKFFLGTFALGAMVQLINLKIHQNTIDLQIRKAETEHLVTFVGQFRDIPHDQKDEKLGYLKFMSFLSQSKEARDQYGSLFDYFDETYKSAEKKEKKLAEIEEKNPEKIKEVSELEQEVFTQVSRNGKELTPDELKVKTEELENLVSDATFKEATSLVDAIHVERAKVDVFSSKKVVDKPTETGINKKLIWENYSWAKAGWYRSYGSASKIYVGVKQLDSRNGEVVFELRRSAEAGERVISTFNLSLNDNSKVVKSGKETYEVILDRIDNEGKNPLKKAAFYSIKCFKDATGPGGGNPGVNPTAGSEG